MKVFQIFLFLCLSFSWLIGQNEGTKLYVKKDSISFYSFDKTGVNEYVILESKKLTKKHIKYS